MAAVKASCVGPFSTFANNYLDVLFTAAFGIVGELIFRLLVRTRSVSNNQFSGVDVAVIMAITMILKDRKEKERYRYIDRKIGAGVI